jgi:beta-glucosidase/6-phospho-beta-glucosidase/beta-galactosidase
MPQGLPNQINQKGIDHYNRLIDEVINNGLIPVVSKVELSNSLDLTFSNSAFLQQIEFKFCSQYSMRLFLYQHISGTDILCI